MPGAPDARYVAARRVLLDALEALGPHRERVVLVGAQAVYQHTGEGELTVIPFTQDADLAIDPRGLDGDPRIEACMRERGFLQHDPAQPGAWYGLGDVEVDLMVPESLGGGGSRAARIPPHDLFAARKAGGLEAAIVDCDWHELASLKPEADARRLRARVAGPAALLVAKLIKVGDRTGQGGDRVRPKDALDIHRLLVTVPEERVTAGFERLIADPVATECTETAIELLRSQFAVARGMGFDLLDTALRGTEHAETAPAQSMVLAQRLLRRLGRTS